MASTYMTPGVYIEEKNAFPGSAVAVETAVPVFIGYTEKAERKGKSLIGEPVRVTSFSEYIQWFGHGFKHQFKIIPPDNTKEITAIDAKATADKAAIDTAATEAKAKEGAVAADIDTKATADKAKIDADVAKAKIKFKTLAELNSDIDAKVTTDKTAIDTAATAAKAKEGAVAADIDTKATADKAKIDADAATAKSTLAEDFNVIKTFKSTDLGDPVQMFYFYNCIRLFYQNGGSNCYIMSLGTYGEGENKKDKIAIDDFPESIFEKLEKVFEPTMVVIPDWVTNSVECYGLYVKVLRHCKKTQSRFGIFDVIPTPLDDKGPESILAFRSAIGSEALNYGAAYFPWLNTSIVPSSEIDFNNLTTTRDVLLPLLLSASDVTKIAAELAKDDKKILDETDPEKKKKIKESSDKQLHQSLFASSIIYTQILAEIRNRLNLLPPSGAMAGIYSLVDNTRGVWKSPANVSVSMVNSPSINISSEEQENMNVDAITGKSINAIRPFPGLGSLVWGARTLDGNSGDWKYINVRRTMIMIEQSLKLACRAYVFEPNDSATWVTMKSMMNNFLNNLWKQGALAGAVPEQAFDVQVGLGATMTPNDILEGLLLVTIKLALVRPAEFIVLTFQQQQQQS